MSIEFYIAGSVFIIAIVVTAYINGWKSAAIRVLCFAGFGAVYVVAVKYFGSTGENVIAALFVLFIAIYYVAQIVKAKTKRDN